MSLDSVTVQLRRRSLTLGDVLWPIPLGLIGIIEAFVEHYTPYLVSIGCLLAACACLTQRRKHPYLTLLGIWGAYAVAPLLGFDVSEPATWILIFVMGCFAVGRHLPRTALPLGFLAVLGFVLGTGFALMAFTSFAPDIFFGAIFGLAPWVLGVAVRQAEDQAITLTRDYERARAEEIMAAERSARAERERIAREIHDVLAHTLSLMIVQADVAGTSVDNDPNAAKRAVGEVQKAGRSALDEVGRLVRLIRREGMLDQVEPYDDVHADLEGSLRRLTEDVSRAGQPVTFVADMEEKLPPALELTVFRLVQEGLTNALKHAPGANTKVWLHGVADEVEVRISNGPATSSPTVSTSQGHGLAGLRERVDLFAGELAYGPDASGGFDIRARIPSGRNESGRIVPGWVTP